MRIIVMDIHNKLKFTADYDATSRDPHYKALTQARQRYPELRFDSTMLESNKEEWNHPEMKEMNK